MSSFTPRPGSASGPRPCPKCHMPSSARRCEACGATLIAGGFRTLRVLSFDVHSRVYEAEDGDGGRVSLNELTFTTPPSVEQLKTFYRKAAQLEAIRHPSIPRLVASFQEGQQGELRLYLAQSFIPGFSLHQQLQDGPPLTEIEASQVARQVLELLVYLHERTPQVLHRDIYPANLVRRPDGRVVLVNFGSARAHLIEPAAIPRGGARLAGYLPAQPGEPPEDVAADLRAVGLTLIQLTTGLEPRAFLDPTGQVVFDERLGVLRRLKKVVRGLVSTVPSERYKSASSALQALRRVSGPGAALRTPLPVPSWLARALVGGLALTLTVAGLLAYRHASVGHAHRPGVLEVFFGAHRAPGASEEGTIPARIEFGVRSHAAEGCGRQVQFTLDSLAVLLTNGAPLLRMTLEAQSQGALPCRMELPTALMDAKGRALGTFRGRALMTPPHGYDRTEWDAELPAGPGQAAPLGTYLVNIGSAGEPDLALRVNLTTHTVQVVRKTARGPEAVHGSVHRLESP